MNVELTCYSDRDIVIISILFLARYLSIQELCNDIRRNFKGNKHDSKLKNDLIRDVMTSDFLT